MLMNPSEGSTTTEHKYIPSENIINCPDGMSASTNYSTTTTEGSNIATHSNIPSHCHHKTFKILMKDRDHESCFLCQKCGRKYENMDGIKQYLANNHLKSLYGYFPYLSDALCTRRYLCNVIGCEKQYAKVIQVKHQIIAEHWKQDGVINQLLLNEVNKRYEDQQQMLTEEEGDIAETEYCCIVPECLNVAIPLVDITRVMESNQSKWRGCKHYNNRCREGDGLLEDELPNVVTTEIYKHYEKTGRKRGRKREGDGLLEDVVTTEIIECHVPKRFLTNEFIEDTNIKASKISVDTVMPRRRRGGRALSVPRLATLNNMSGNSDGATKELFQVACLQVSRGGYVCQYPGCSQYQEGAQKLMALKAHAYLKHYLELKQNTAVPGAAAHQHQNIEITPAGMSTDSIPESIKMESIPESIKMESIPESIKMESIPESIKMESIPESIKMESIPASIKMESIPESIKMESIAFNRNQNENSGTTGENNPDADIPEHNPDANNPEHHPDTNNPKHNPDKPNNPNNTNNPDTIIRLTLLNGETSFLCLCHFRCGMNYKDMNSIACHIRNNKVENRKATKKRKRKGKSERKKPKKPKNFLRQVQEGCDIDTIF